MQPGMGFTWGEGLEVDLADVLHKCMQVTHLWYGEPTRVTLNPPAPDSLLKKANIPDQYRSFLRLATGNHLGMARDGSVWFLDHEYGPSEWYEGKGSWFAGPDLATFLLKFAEEKGRWWFLPNQS
nr:MAG: hypothetical protein DIU70_06420 [Bacillota bacterium]